MESNDDDTEPTKPFSNPILSSVLNNSNQPDLSKSNIKPQIQQKIYYAEQEDDISDLESNTYYNEVNFIIQHRN